MFFLLMDRHQLVATLRAHAVGLAAIFVPSRLDGGQTLFSKGFDPRTVECHHAAAGIAVPRMS
jgi:hypothetical protein